jgi:hypothetical protein
MVFAKDSVWLSSARFSTFLMVILGFFKWNRA